MMRIIHKQILRDLRPLVSVVFAFIVFGRQTAMAERPWAPGANRPDKKGMGGLNIPLDISIAPHIGRFTEESFDFFGQETTKESRNGPGLILEASYRAWSQYRSPSSGGLALDLPLTLAGSINGFDFDYWIVQAYLMPTLRYDITTKSGVSFSPGVGVGMGAVAILGIGNYVQRSIAWRIGLNTMLSTRVGFAANYLSADWPDSELRYFRLSSNITLVSLGIVYRLR